MGPSRLQHTGSPRPERTEEARSKERNEETERRSQKTLPDFDPLLRLALWGIMHDPETRSYVPSWPLLVADWERSEFCYEPANDFQRGICALFRQNWRARICVNVLFKDAYMTYVGLTGTNEGAQAVPQCSSLRQRHQRPSGPLRLGCISMNIYRWAFPTRYGMSYCVPNYFRRQFNSPQQTVQPERHTASNKRVRHARFVSR
jgi:hypothetical protein